MTHKAVSVIIISSISNYSINSLCKKLVSIGYKNIKIIDCNDYIQKYVSGNSIVILPVNKKWNADIPSDIITILPKIYHHPILGVLHSSLDIQNCKALTYCNDFFYWPCTNKEIVFRIERLVQLFQVSNKAENNDHVCDEFLSLNIVGSAPAFIEVLQRIKKIARCDAPVLIEGESGTGKELTARAIHYLSERRDYPFIPVNCGAIPDNLLENELFGHRQGAFTDAKSNQEGLVCQADRGTLFFDEVETFSQKGQVVLLRFLQDLQYKSLGSSRNKQADIRIIAASNANLAELVKQGVFRKDLYYRLNIMTVLLPPLYQRGDDVLKLVNYFLNKFSLQYNQPAKRLDQDSILWLMRYNWPGNIRQLENLLHREFLLSEGPCIKLNTDSPVIQERRTSKLDRRQERFLKNNMQDAKAEIVRHFEVQYLNSLLNSTNGNVTMAAKIAGKERRSLGKLIKKHGLDKYSIR